jgi:hypothetical protein
MSSTANSKRVGKMAGVLICSECPPPPPPPRFLIRKIWQEIVKSKPDSLKRDSLIRVSVLGHDMDQGVLLYRNHHFTKEEIRKK